MQKTERAERLGAFGVVVLAGMFLAALQSPLGAVAPGIPLEGSLDDLALLGMVALALPYLSRAPGYAVFGLVAWGLLIAMGAANSSLSASDTFIVARQVIVPALLIFVGLALTGYQWERARRFAIWIAVANALYMVVEFAGIRVFDPLSLETFNAGRGAVLDGLPSYYRYYLEGRTIDRLGGTVLNPPIAGLVTAAGFVFLWHDPTFKRRKLLLVLLAVVTVLTFSRGALLIIGLSVALPAMAKRIGNIGAFVLIAPGLWLAGSRLAGDGNSISHANGLLVGLQHALEPPFFGRGFGLVGNYVKSMDLDLASESLLGIAFSAAGLGTVALVAVLLLLLWRANGRTPDIWESSLAMGIIAAALFSESAGALNGSIPLWLAVGVALRRIHERKHETLGRASRLSRRADQYRLRDRAVVRRR